MSDSASEALETHTVRQLLVAVEFSPMSRRDFPLCIRFSKIFRVLDCLDNRRTGIAKQEEHILHCSEGDTAKVSDIDLVLVPSRVGPRCSAQRPIRGQEIVRVEQNRRRGGGREGSSRGDVH